jgi:MFS family permease
MFLQYAAQGALIPLFSVRLAELGFSPVEIGWACAMQPLAALVAPLLAGQVADRWVAAERCLAVCAALAGGLLWLMAGLTSPGAVFAATLAYWLVMGPASTLGNALGFIHLARPERDFGRIRMWGTIGWAAAGWLVGLAVRPQAWLVAAGWTGGLVNIFRVGAVLAFALAAYALTLPHTPPQRRRGAWLAPLAALRLLSGRPFAVYAVCLFGVNVTLPFYAQVVPLFLEHHGVPREWLGPAMTIGQSMEIVALGLLPILLLRLGLRGTMLLGLAAWAALLGAFTLGEPLWLAVASLGLNGLCICGFLVAGQVFVNGKARGDLRASAQALVAFITGPGLLVGHLLAGWVRQEAGGAFPATFGVAAAIALALVAIFLVGFKEAEPAADAVPEAQPVPGTAAV